MTDAELEQLWRTRQETAENEAQKYPPRSPTWEHLQAYAEAFYTAAADLARARRGLEPRPHYLDELAEATG